MASLHQFLQFKLLLLPYSSLCLLQATTFNSLIVLEEEVVIISRSIVQEFFLLIQGQQGAGVISHYIGHRYVRNTW